MEVEALEIYEVVQRIFRHLPIRSIQSASSVCRLWSEVAEKTKRFRSTIETFVYSSTSINELDQFNASLSLMINDRLWSIPSFIFIVATRSLDDQGLSSFVDEPSRKSQRTSTTDHQANRSIKRTKIFTALTNQFNRSSRKLMIVSSGIIHNDRQFEIGDALAMLLLPEFPPNICGIYPFEIPRQTSISSMNRADLHRILGGIPDDLSIRFVILFYRQPNRQSNDLLRKLKEFYPTDLVISGAAIDRIRLNNETISSSFISGFALTGEKTSLNIQQIVVDDEPAGRDSVRKQLSRFQSNEGQWSFAIQLSCVGRDSEFYSDEENVECSEFRRIFPRTPLIGVYGNGELGHDFLADESQRTDVRFRTYSSVFTHFSLHV